MSFLCALAIGAFAALTTPALAETVTLTNGAKIDAQTVAREGDNYRITLPSLPNDILTIPATEIACVGDEACPKTINPQVELQHQAARGPALKGHIIISGSTTIGEALMPELITSFGKAHGYNVDPTTEDIPNGQHTTFELTREDDPSNKVVIELNATGSDDAYKDMTDPSVKAAIGMRSSPATSADKDKARAAGFADPAGLDSEHVLAFDGLTIIVNKDNPTGALSTEQVAKIFAGEIRNWSEIGGSAGAIKLYRRDDRSGTTDTFRAFILRQPSGERKILFSAKESTGSSQIVDDVANDPNGIGYVGMGFVGSKVRPLSILTSCGVAAKPSYFGVKIGEYPLTRRLFLYTNGQPSDPLAKALLDYSLSEAAYPIVESDQIRFVSFKNAFSSFDEQTQRVLQVATGKDPAPLLTRQFFQDAQYMMRASLTIRFLKNSLTPTAQSQADLGRLARELRSPSLARTRFLIAGFASEQDGSDANMRQLAFDRAQQVGIALQNGGAQFGDNLAKINGYANGAPVTCGATPSELDLNQRVEIWQADDHIIGAAPMRAR